jgi:hypothetical protein
MDDKNKTASLYSKIRNWLGAAFQAVIHKPLLASVVILVIAGLLITGVLVALRDDSKPSYTTNKGTDAGEEDSTADETPTNTGAPKNSQNKPKSGATTPKQTDPCVADPDICKFATSTYDYSKVAHVVEESQKPNGRPDLKSRLQSTDGQGNTRYVQYSTSSETETVVYDGYAYKKDNSDGTWVKYPLNDPASAPLYAPGTKSGISIDHSQFNYKRGTPVACGNAQCVGYAITSRDPDSSDWTASLVFELGTYRLHSYSMDVSSSTYTYFTRQKITYADVTIAEPSPVKNP